MGYVDDLRLMLKGSFTTMEPNFPSSGAPTLTVRGLNVLHQLRRKQYTGSWVDKKDSEIAENIATLRDQGKKRFPLPITTDSNAKNEEDRIPIVSQKSMYDIDFLFARARRRGYVVFVKEANEEKRTPEQLYFGPSDGSENPSLREVTFKLEWGKTLIDFKPTLTTANQIKSVTVNGWNRNTRKAISATVNLDDRDFRRRNVDLYELLNKCDPREEVVVDEPVFNEQQAKRRAIAILTDRQKEMVKAGATSIGLPDLRAGQRVQIDGVGSRFSGTYFITDTNHTIGSAGYTTKFNARREDEGGGNGS
jgi:phage protein D